MVKRKVTARLEIQKLSGRESAHWTRLFLNQCQRIDARELTRLWNNFRLCSNENPNAFVVEPEFIVIHMIDACFQNFHETQIWNLNLSCRMTKIISQQQFKNKFFFQNAELVINMMPKQKIDVMPKSSNTFLRDRSCCVFRDRDNVIKNHKFIQLSIFFINLKFKDFRSDIIIFWAFAYYIGIIFACSHLFWSKKSNSNVGKLEMVLNLNSRNDFKFNATQIIIKRRFYSWIHSNQNWNFFDAKNLK